MAFPDSQPPHTPPTDRERPRLAFVYGAREVMWPGVGRRLFPRFGRWLFRHESALDRTLRRCEELVQDRLGWSIRKTCSANVYIPGERIEPCLTSIQIALTDEWRERGVVPDVIVARCGGEFAAEYARGSLSIEDAIEVACRISELLKSGRGSGRFIQLRVNIAGAKRLVETCPCACWIAADAGDDTLIACEIDHAEAVSKFLSASNVDHQLVRAPLGAHSPLVDCWKDDLLKPLPRSRVPPREPVYYSAAVSGPDEGGPYLPRLWRTVREPTLFVPTIRNAIADGCDVILEIGPKAHFVQTIRAQAQSLDRTVRLLPSMRAGRPLRRTLNRTERALRRRGLVNGTN